MHLPSRNLIETAMIRFLDGKRICFQCSSPAAHSACEAPIGVSLRDGVQLSGSNRAATQRQLQQATGQEFELSQAVQQGACLGQHARHPQRPKPAGLRILPALLAVGALAPAPASPAWPSLAHPGCEIRCMRPITDSERDSTLLERLFCWRQ